GGRAPRRRDSPRSPGVRALASLSAAAVAAYAWPALSGGPAVPVPGVVRRGPDRSTVALTFDDGPSPRGTEVVLEALDLLELPATFCVVGGQVRKRPRLVAEIVRRGHEVGLHGDRHVAHVSRPPRAIWRDLERGLARVEDAAGGRVTALRAPYGAA